ncbi:thiazolylpeptide-type bacteriocin precursor [Streptomyces puniciscabiei]|uniref:Thiazolylpeptide-type bacteriocin n=1 Tax=Streptomyces puniciscabiei TaxID=164348 RepID=A0A542UH73_9ACTN|nr:thiazolylpeptide-type bacteriocin [Streptomyces puniciscabiei]TQK98430.1 thiazolylpeptide-type bacteriocin precursor [Streptomyces puniciscabiei]
MAMTTELADPTQEMPALEAETFEIEDYAESQGKLLGVSSTSCDSSSCSSSTTSTTSCSCA